MKTIAFVNQKGGSGKTTSTIGLGAGLSLCGKNVLLVDLDPQAHLGIGLGIKTDYKAPSVYQLLRHDDVKYTDVMVGRANDTLQLLPSNINLSGAEAELAGIAGRELLLREKLKAVTNVDYIIIDCPPSLGILSLNALCAADEIYVPVQVEFLALQGVSTLLKTVEIVRKRLNQDLKIGGFIATRFDQRKNLNRAVVARLQHHFKQRTFKVLIRDNIALAEAISLGQTIFQYRPASHGAQDYLNLTKEFLERQGNGY